MNRCRDVILGSLQAMTRMHGHPNETTYTRRKLRSFYQIQRLHAILPQPNHLYTLLYARYCAQREIMTTLYGEDVSKEEESHLEQRFITFLNDTYPSPSSFEEAYLRMLTEWKSPAVVQHYAALNSTMHHHKRTFNEKELEAFVQGCVATEPLLESKLQQDILRFTPFHERVMWNLQYYRPVRDWLVGGVLVLWCGLTFSRLT